jgi:biotin carboxyl carrier protein
MRIRWRDEEREVPDEPIPSGVEEAGHVRSFVDGDRVWVWSRGRAHEFSVERAASSRARSSRRADAAGGLRSPMPGRVRKVLVAEGDRVAKGQVLLVLEAMKMEHAIRSPHEGVVVRLALAEGDLVEAGAELAEVAPG